MRKPLPLVKGRRITREEVIEGMWCMYSELCNLKRKNNPTFKDNPDWVKVMNYIEVHGLEPRSKD